MKCLSCKYCVPDDIDPETLNVTFFCELHKKGVNPISYCFDFIDEE